jgi:hypothetical protein
MSREDCLKKLQGFTGQGDKYNGIMLWIPDTKQIFQVMIGTGDNLLDEDYEAGYDSYLYIQLYGYDDPGFEEIDGGDMMYRSDEETYDEDICTAVYDALKFFYEYVPDFIPLQLFMH